MKWDFKQKNTEIKIKLEKEKFGGNYANKSK